MGIGVCTVWTKDCQDTLNMMYFFFFLSLYALGALAGKNTYPDAYRESRSKCILLLSFS